jgi:mRNA interferase RelE/StbE
VSYRVELETRARREFLDLPKPIQPMLADVIDDLGRNPRPPGAKKLVERGGYRIRKGSYRVLYAVDDRARVVRIYRVGHRRDIYRRRR